LIDTSHFVLYYAGPNAPSRVDELKIRSIPGLTVLDQASPKLLLVDAPNEELQEAMRQLEGWTFEREQPAQTGIERSSK
jgi:hypothetical protein